MSQRFSGQRIKLTRPQMREQGVCLLAYDLLEKPGNISKSLPKEHTVARAAGQLLCRQIAIANGLHTCDMTAMVNGYIWQGWLTTDQGKAVHERFPDFYPNRNFTQRIIKGKKVMVAGREEAAISSIAGEKLLSATITQGDLGRHQVINRIIRALSNDIVLNVGDGGHARLAVGYRQEDDETILKLSNPYNPEKSEELPVGAALEFRASNAITGIAQREASLSYPV